MATTIFEMNSHWVASSQTWVCPCCERSKYSISRLGNKNQILAKLVIRHDHMSQALEAAFRRAFERAGTTAPQGEGQQLVERIASAFAAYPDVLVCEDCNNADTEAKKLAGAPDYFSFSIGQIRGVIDIGEHRKHRVEEKAATLAWRSAKSAYELRIRLIDSVARAAATDQHWYEPFDRAKQPIPILGYGNRVGDAVISRWVSFDEVQKALGPKKSADNGRDLTRWRTTAPGRDRPLPTNFLPVLQSDVAFAKWWVSVPDDWVCPICLRRKVETVYVADSGKVTFMLRRNPGRGDWLHAMDICNHCSGTLMSLKLEVVSKIGRPLPSSYEFVSPQELSEIIKPRPHSPHGIVSARAAALVTTCVSKVNGADS
jgi:rubredoxin